MSRVPIAIIVGLAGFAAYVILVVTIADGIAGAHWAVQAIYFLVFGSVWVMPARWLMLWAAHQR